MKNYIIVLATAFVLLFVFVAVIFNPYDKQYQSYYDENAGRDAYSNNDINSFFKYMDNSITVKYHTGNMLILSALYKHTGRYVDSLRVLNTYEREHDYSFCAASEDPVKKMACRIFYSFPLYKKYEDINESISKVYYENGDYKKAEEYNLKADKINYCYNARIYANLNDFEKAEKNLKECVIKNQEVYTAEYRSEVKGFVFPNTKDITKTRGVIFFKEKKYPQAEKEYLSLIHKGCLKSPKCKGNNNVYMLLGELYFEQGNYAKALSYYKKVLKTEPYTYKANYYAAQCDLKLNKNAEAMAYLKKILSYNPDNKAEIESLIAKINRN